MKIQEPKIDARTFEQFLEDARAKAPFYTPEWNPRQEKDGAQALLRIYLHLLTHVTRRLNQTPDKNLVAFLHHLGIRLQPAQSARAVVTFALAAGTSVHVSIPKGTQLAGEGLDGEEVIFETETALRATPARLQDVYSMDTRTDELYEHTAKLDAPEGFELFTGQNQQERSLYIGHAELLEQANPTTISIDFTLAVGASPGILELIWEYWNGQRWVALQTFSSAVSDPLDTTTLLSKSGRMTFTKPAGEFASLELLDGIESRWLRCRLKNPLSSLRQIRLPEITTLRLDVSPANPFPAELAFQNDIPLNLDKLSSTDPIHPFGRLPRRFDTFYLASDEAFSKRGAKITLELESHWQQDGPEADDPTPVLSWEYWNGKGWRALSDLNDKTSDFKEEGDISFTCPDDIDKVEINGEDKFWIRVRLIDGDYGKEFIIKTEEKSFTIPPTVIQIPGFEVSITDTDADTDIEVPGNEITIPGVEIPTAGVVLEEGKVQYPVITYVAITYENAPREPETCVSLNNLNYVDHMGALQDVDQTFVPYRLLSERVPSFFLGFDKKIEGGPISILFHLQEPLAAPEAKLNWFYWNGSSWVLLNVSDGTRNFAQIGLLTFAVPNDFHSLELFDKTRFWLKGIVVEGEYAQPPTLFGIWVNSAAATQASVIVDEIVGSSQAVAQQEFPLLNAMIINQEVYVRERTRPNEEERQAIFKAEGVDAIAEQPDERGDIQHYKIRWHEVDDFDQSGPNDRHYTVDKRLGVIAFGDGVHGMIPPPGGDTIRANYRFGGGTNGNVEVGKIASLKNAIPFVDQVTNHIRADGGSATETLDEVRTRGPQKLKHQERAMSQTDFEALAQSASRTVARAKCLANTNDRGEHAPGHVTVIIVPDSQRRGEPPSRVLIDIVLNDLKARTAYAISASNHIHVRGAGYIEIAVEPTIVPTTLEAAARAEDAVIAALQHYIHPLTGGPCKDGWAFGGTVCRTELFALLEGIAEVDHVPDIVIRVKGEVQGDDVVMGPDQLPFSGEHKVNIQLPGAQPERGASRSHTYA